MAGITVRRYHLGDGSFTEISFFGGAFRCSNAEAEELLALFAMQWFLYDFDEAGNLF